MHVWGGAQHTHGDTHQQGDDRHSGSQHHGQQAHGQCYAVWYVSVACKPDGCISHGSCLGRAGTYALHSHDHGTVGTGRTHGDAGQYADSEQQLQTDVHVGWCHLHHRTGPVHSDGALTACAEKRAIEKYTKVMDYRFTMTSRLIALSVISFLILLGLLFALGFQLGLQWGTEEANAQLRAATSTLRPVSVGPPVSVPATIPAATVTVPAIPAGLSTTPR